MPARRVQRPFSLAAGAAAGGAVLFAPAAEAATITVTNLNDSGEGSLRDAVLDANADPGADQVVFDASLSGTITLTSGQLEINEPVAIQGPGANVITVSGGDAQRIFYARPNDGVDAVSISGLTLADGSAAGDGGAFYGRALDLSIADTVFRGNDASDVGGALFPIDSSVTIANSTFSNNHAADSGGAIFSQDGTLNVTGSSLTENTAEFGGGALFVSETPAAGDADDIVLRDSTFSANRAGASNGEGGAMFVEDAEDGVLLERVSVVGNTAVDGGGGLLQSSDPTSRLRIVSSTFSGNDGDSDDDTNGPGGGVDFFAGGPMDVSNSTFSGNTSYYGGGIAAYNTYDEPVSISNSTIVDNASVNPAGGGGIVGYGQDNPMHDGTDTLELSSTIIAGNTAPVNPDLGGNDSGELEVSAGFTLIETTGNVPVTESPAGSNLLGVDPLLGPLHDNGGPTQTHAPLIGSPVLDAGLANGLPTDQRGAPRTFDAANVANRAGSDGTDIGAVELLPGGRLALERCKTRTENVLFAPGSPILGTDGGDVIVGTDAADQINSGRGKDLVCAGGENDRVKTGAGHDRAFGEAGRDRMSGQGGRDKLSGQGGKDTLKGGGDNDNLKGGGGRDTLKGGPGKDRLRGGAGKDRLRGGGGKDSERQ